MGSVYSSAADFSKPETKILSEKYDLISDDGSEIRNLVGIKSGKSVHCKLPVNGVTKASRHKTVDQIWYVLSGEGEIWRKDLQGQQIIVPLRKNIALSVRLGIAFQFRNSGGVPLEIFIVNSPHWSGPGELIPVDDFWAPNVSK